MTCKDSQSSREMIHNAFVEQWARAQQAQLQTRSPNHVVVDVDGPKAWRKVVAKNVAHREAFSLTYKGAHNFGRIAWGRVRCTPFDGLEAPETGRMMKVGLEMLPEGHDFGFFRVHPLTFHKNVFVGWCEDLCEELFGVGRKVYSDSNRVPQAKAMRLDVSILATSQGARPQKKATTQNQPRAVVEEVCAPLEDPVELNEWLLLKAFMVAFMLSIVTELEKRKAPGCPPCPAPLPLKLTTYGYAALVSVEFLLRSMVQGFLELWSKTWSWNLVDTCVVVCAAALAIFG